MSGRSEGQPKPNARVRTPPGVRFSALDAALLLLAALVSALTWNLFGVGVGRLIAMTVGHFFLFCNILRLRTSYELVWAMAFVAIAVGVTVVRAEPSWGHVLVLILPVTAALAGLEIGSGNYRGLGWRLAPRSKPRNR